MQNWDDHRIFLAVARETSIKKAADTLVVNRSTVLRRITAFETRLGVRLFERLPDGYFTTPAGEEMMQSTIKMEAAADEASRRVAGRDNRLSGTITVSLSVALAAYVLMPDLAAFSQAHPGIRLEILSTYDMPDLARREADVAIRISNDPPEDLVGRRVVKVARAAYIGAAHIGEARGRHARPNDPDASLSLIGWSTDPSSLQWAEDSHIPRLPVGTIITDPFATVKALEAGMGISILPCYMGDSEPGLCRIPAGNLQRLTDLWILTHRDLRHTARIRQFTSYIAGSVLQHRDLLEGRCERPASST